MLLGIAPPWDPRKVPSGPKAPDSPLTSAKRFGVWSLGAEVWSVGMMVWGFGLRVKGLGLRVEG